MVDHGAPQCFPFGTANWCAGLSKIPGSPLFPQAVVSEILDISHRLWSRDPPRHTPVAIAMERDACWILVMWPLYIYIYIYIYIEREREREREDINLTLTDIRRYLKGRVYCEVTLPQSINRFVGSHFVEFWYVLIFLKIWINESQESTENYDISATKPCAFLWIW